MLTLGKYKFNLDEGSPENRLYLCTDENGKKRGMSSCILPRVNTAAKRFARH